MDKRYGLWRFGLKLSLLLIVMGCTPQDNADQQGNYQPVNLAEIKGELTGDDPRVITLELFGVKEEAEGNFTQEIKVVKQQGFQQTMMLTQMNLPDDSVKGIRYQLQFEFSQSEGKWRLSEAGRQQSCYRGENPNEWTIEPCP